ncbi:ABC transporter permease [Dinghuibacter silviterrae]|uniref:ABC-type antimicrobial peptide transport system permease subunit n=1 Tax=Dinghuibacter silviterrae TaxID=1539049 RepID=A0A4R8DEZ5_9BACT|nr:ABC transporter permease [Dinghuibacter silviterrae]TDW95804.1 ABC-type antimicrobial peptide transport system permease subunit [Dinghuibacter silviterrae]
MKYTTVEELLMDDGFLAWYHLSDDKQIEFWDAWIASSEEHRALARAAVQTLQYLQFRPQTQKNLQEKADQIWDRIKTNIRKEATPQKIKTKTASPVMLASSYMKVALRNFRNGKMHSLINISGLSVGMAVAVLIGLWIMDELSYNTYHANYSQTAQVMIHGTQNGSGFADGSVPIPLAQAIRSTHGSDFERIGLATFPGGGHTLAAGDNKFTEPGAFMEQEASDILALKLRKGSLSLSDPHTILLSETTAQKLFGARDPIGRIVKMDNNGRLVLKVTGVYEDVPDNDDFKDLHFLCPWELFVTSWDWIKPALTDWEFTATSILVQIPEHRDFNVLSAKIKDLITQNWKPKEKGIHEDVFLFPMSRWHLYSNFENGVNTGGLITFVWLFGIIGVFVLLLACINFMNLSTARSEKRAREVGIRKVMGSVRGQLIQQFLSESILIALMAFVLSLGLAQLVLPWFDGIAGKRLDMPWFNGWFWGMGLVFTLFTGIIAGSYPALFLSSFQPVKVLKGTFRLGRFAAAPRKVLVVFQFAISVLLINGTIIVFREINYAKDRPTGYDRAGLISIQETTPEVYNNYSIIRSELLRTGAATNMAESQCPVTNIFAGANGYDWPGKTAGQADNFAVVDVRHEFGQTIGWQVVQGRDFSKAYPSDSMGMILNESAVKFMGLKHPIGAIVHDRDHKTYTVIGIVKDIIQTNPYGNIPQTIYTILHEGGNFLTIRLNPALGPQEALKRVEAVFKQYNPAAPFAYTFADKDYAKKFGDEERLGSLALFFALLAIFISALGLFGLASFVAEQRTKEIGIRKVLGASLLSLWQLLSGEFAILILMSLVIATPLARYFMGQWLSHYNYRTGIPWWIFAGAGLGAMILTMSTVSYQSIKAALLSPVKSLRTE